MPRKYYTMRRVSLYGRAIEFVSRNEQKLLNRLGPDDKKLFEAYVDTQDEVNQLIAVQNLIYGFRFGLIMTAESFVGKDDLYVKGNDL